MKVVFALAFLVVTTALKIPSADFQPIKLSIYSSPFGAEADDTAKESIDHKPIAKQTGLFSVKAGLPNDQAKLNFDHLKNTPGQSGSIIDADADAHHVLVANIPEEYVEHEPIVGVDQGELNFDQTELNFDHLKSRPRQTGSVIDARSSVVSPKANDESFDAAIPEEYVYHEPIVEDELRSDFLPFEADDYLRDTPGQPVSVIDARPFFVPPEVMAKLASMLKMNSGRQVVDIPVEDPAERVQFAEPLEEIISSPVQVAESPMEGAPQWLDYENPL